MGQQIVDGVAAGRGLPSPQVRSAMDSGPLLPEAALQYKLIDGILYRDEVGALLNHPAAARGAEAGAEARAPQTNPSEAKAPMAYLETVFHWIAPMLQFRFSTSSRRALAFSRRRG